MEFAVVEGLIIFVSQADVAHLFGDLYGILEALRSTASFEYGEGLSFVFVWEGKQPVYMGIFGKLKEVIRLLCIRIALETSICLV